MLPLQYLVRQVILLNSTFCITCKLGLVLMSNQRVSYFESEIVFSPVKNSVRGFQGRDLGVFDFHLGIMNTTDLAQW